MVLSLSFQAHYKGKLAIVQKKSACEFRCKQTAAPTEHEQCLIVT